MNTNSSELRSFPPAEDFIAFVKSVDWKSVYNSIINVCLIVAAIVSVVGSKILNAVVTYWEINGDAIIDRIYIAAAISYNKAREFRSFVITNYKTAKDIYELATM